MSVGNNKAEMLRSVRNLSHVYEQTILIGHPFLYKGIMGRGDSGGSNGKRRTSG